MTWLREMAALVRKWWQTELEYRASMRALKKRVKELGREIHESRRPLDEAKLSAEYRMHLKAAVDDQRREGAA